MRKFFHSIVEIGRFIGNLRAFKHSCPHCEATDTLCSHGFIHKLGQFSSKHLIGKRVYCSNRHQKNGCGRTFQLYLADFIPNLHFSIVDFESEIRRCMQILIPIYPGCFSHRRCHSRTRFRWLRKLKNKIPFIREHLIKSDPLALDRPHNESQNPLQFTLITFFSNSLECFFTLQLNAQKSII